MNWKRKLELICGLITLLLGMIVVIIVLYFQHTITKQLQQPSQLLKTFVIFFILYGLPAFLIAVGGYQHAIRRQSWGRVLLISTTCFLVILLFLSLVVLMWSGAIIPVGLLTVFAILTTVTSLFVRGDT